MGGFLADLLGSLVGLSLSPEIPIAVVVTVVKGRDARSFVLWALGGAIVVSIARVLLDAAISPSPLNPKQQIWFSFVTVVAVFLWAGIGAAFRAKIQRLRRM
jgi:hypothetical protein